MITKIPGFIFSSYKQIQFAGSILMSTPQYLEILNDVFLNNPDSKKKYDTLMN